MKYKRKSDGWLVDGMLVKNWTGDFYRYSPVDKKENEVWFFDTPQIKFENEFEPVEETK
jgi:hypothetical protein